MPCLAKKKHCFRATARRQGRPARFEFRLAVLCCLLTSAVTILATPINYGNLNAVDVVYQQVTEDSSTDPTPLFGAPSTAGDALIFNPVSFSASMLYSPSAGTYNLIDDAGIGVIWQGSLLLDINAALSQAGYTGKATKLDLTLDNTLLVTSEAGTVAYIKKKQFDGITITTIVPEPSSFALLGVGALSLLACARRSGRG